MSLDTSKLENVRRKGEKITARCPVCAEDGNDKSGEHLVVESSGKFGCVMYPGAQGAEHRKRIFALVGEKSEPAAKPGNIRGKVHETLDDAIAAAMEYDKGLHGGRVTRKDKYHKGDGSHLFTVVRFDFDDHGKTYRPFHRNGAGYRSGDPAGKLPLYRLPELNASKGRVYVCEGEKCVEALAELGLVATTSAHGAKSAHKSDWQPLAGREVVILPDADNDGAAYAKTVSEILSQLCPAAQVRIVALPGLSEGQDVFDFIQERKTHENR